jgi:hypothetical protein
LSKAFEVWYPELENRLNQLTDSSDESEDHSEDSIGIASYSHIFEEILDLSRTNQKLLRNSEGTLEKDLGTLKDMVLQTQEYTKRNLRTNRSMHRRKYHPMMIEQILHAPFLSDSFLGVQVVLSFFKEDFPWVYDAGTDLIQQLKSGGSLDKKNAAIENYRELLDFTFRNPMIREIYSPDDDVWVWRKQLHHFLISALERKSIEEL